MAPVQHRKKLEPCKLPGQAGQLAPLIRWARSHDSRCTGAAAAVIGSLRARTQYILQGSSDRLAKAVAHSFVQPSTGRSRQERCKKSLKPRPAPRVTPISRHHDLFFSSDHVALSNIKRQRHSEQIWRICKVISQSSQWLSKRGVWTSCTSISAAALRLLWVDLPNE
jgi:hypothetical protein